MSANLIRPSTERVTIAGPAGDLEALLEIPAGADGTRVAVVCHPHPVYGGTMTNKVVHILAKAFDERGVPAVRFNFRGVGASAGAYDEGEGETQDALAVMDWALQRFAGRGTVGRGFFLRWRDCRARSRGARRETPGHGCTCGPSVRRRRCTAAALSVAARARGSR